MKEKGFIALLKDRGFEPDNIGYMADAHGRGRTGVSCKITIGKKSYAIWMMQKDFPRGIYVCAVTKLVACVIWPVYEFYSSRDMLDFVSFIDKLKGGVDESNPENFTHPWTELSERILDV